MSKLQLVTVFSAVFLLFALQWGFDTKPQKQTAVEASRALQTESTAINSLLLSAKADLTESDAATIVLLEQSLTEAPSDSQRVSVLEQLSRIWFEKGHPEVAGYYAEELANISGTEQAWSIAGTTYAIGLQRATDEKVKSYCSGRAVRAFESAISINPDEIAHQVNLALCYTEYPPKDNPMKGILMLIDLNKKHPDDVLVLINLGRLAIKTGQYAKAVERLEKAASLEPKNGRIFCLLAEAYQGLGQTDKVNQIQQKCAALSD